ncbi:unnamed protein product [Closterium sp. NIES-53]
MATLRVLRFDAEGRPLDFPTRLLRAERYLQRQREENDTRWAHASGDLPSPPLPAALPDEPANAHQDAAMSIWQSCDAVACIALGSLLLESEEDHFTHVRSAKDLLAAIKSHYSTPSSA